MKTVLLTGSNGFLGRYIKSQLEMNNFKVLTLGRTNCEISFDLTHGIPELPKDIEYVIHAAGKAHVVPKTEEESQQFFDTNYNGTLNLLEGLKQSGSNVKGIIFISSVAVYGLTEGQNIAETTPLLATDPYGKSKIMAEEAIIAYCKNQNINYCILRLPLIAGINPPGNLGAMIKAIKKGWYLSIGKADVKKSIVLASDVAFIIPQLFEKSGIYNLSDGFHPTFHELETKISSLLNKKNPLKIPQFMADMLAKAGDILGKKFPINTNKLKKIQSELTFSDAKAVTEIGWKPKKVIDSLSDIL